MQEKHEAKYIQELIDFFDKFGANLIDEIYVGAGISVGLSRKQAENLLRNKPGKLEKAVFSKVLDRFKSIFKKKHKPSEFSPPKIPLKDSTITSEVWERFNQSLDKYWKNEANKVTGDVTAKSFVLARNTLQFKEKKKPYQNKSLYQIAEDQYHGDMPASIEELYKKYNFKNSEKKALNRAFANTAMYVTQANNEVREAIRQVVNKGINEGKSGVEIASDLYWNVEKDENLTNRYTAETLKRNWSRVAQTEVASIYEAGILAPDEAEAVESLQNPEKAKYYIRTGGTCDWCRSKQGTLVRLVPAEIVKDRQSESLSSMGIEDPNTDIAIWIGKNNVGIKKQENWLICCPAHPYNVATFSPIDLATEFYNEKTKNVEKRQVKKKFVPAITQVEELDRTPKRIGDNQVRVGNNVYESVSSSEFNDKLRAWQRDPTLPIPVNRNSPQYLRLFEGAK